LSCLLALNRITHRFNTHLVLDDLNLELAAATRLTIAGRSGAGKSTLLRLIAGLEAPQQGEITIGGKTASSKNRIHLPPWQRGIQMVFQDLGLWPSRSAQQNISDSLRAGGMDKSKAQQLAIESLERVGLGGMESRFPASLSGGEARRLAFARALASHPQLLLLDEPFASLDPVARAEGLDFLDEVLSISDAAVILVTHEPAEALRLGGQVAILNNGKLQTSVSAVELCADPEHFRQALEA
jgi:iron(III) transport system ATP-binding protein